MSCTNGRTWTSLGVCLLMAIQAGMETTAAEEGVFVAVGYGGRRMVSKDGKTWEITAEWAVNGADDSNNLMSIAHGNGRFVAVGGGGWTRETQAGHILVSTDGKTWKETLKLANRVNPVIFGNGLFVTSGPPDKTLYSSADGETWQAGAKVPFEGWALWFRQGAYGNGTFVMMGECMPKKEKYWVVASPDGKTISHFSTDLPHLRSLAFGG